MGSVSIESPGSAESDGASSEEGSPASEFPMGVSTEGVGSLVGEGSEIGAEGGKETSSAKTRLTGQRAKR